MGKKDAANGRNFFRVDANVPLVSCLVPSDEKDDLFSEIVSRESVPALSECPLKRIDLSGGGMSFATAERYVKGDIIEISMILEKVHEGVLIIYGEVVRSEHVGGQYMVAVRFISMDDRIRDLIIRFVFAREREIIAEKRIGWL